MRLWERITRICETLGEDSLWERICEDSCQTLGGGFDMRICEDL